MNDITTQIGQLLESAGMKPTRGKDLSNHHIGMPKMEEATIQDILKRADDAEIREDVFLQAVCLELQSKRERLRHRADMMRRRAEEFDQMADELGNTEEGVKDYVFRLVHHIQEIEELLKKHAHIEPQRVNNG